MQNEIIPCLWFDTQAEEAANYYVSIFKNGKIGNILHYTEAGKEQHQKPPGSVVTVDFTINGQEFVALNGGPQFKFNESVSFQIMCDTQEEIDHYWEKLTAGGEESWCGWLKDKYGVSWQVVPKILLELIKDPARVERVTAAYMQMQKFDIEKLENA